MWDRWYFLSVGFFLLLIWIKSFEFLSLKKMGFAEFELTVCVASIMVLVYTLLKVFRSESVVSKIDVLIDGFVYKGDSKEYTYRKLRINRMGVPSLNLVQKKLKKLAEMLRYIRKKDRHWKRLRRRLKTPISGLMNWKDMCFR